MRETWWRRAPLKKAAAEGLGPMGAPSLPPAAQCSEKDRPILGRLISPERLKALATQHDVLGSSAPDLPAHGARCGAPFRPSAAGLPPARIPEQQRESVRAGIAGHEHGDGQFVLDPKTGVLGLTWRIRLFDAWQLSQQPVQRTFCSNGRGTW